MRVAQVDLLLIAAATATGVVVVGCATWPIARHCYCALAVTFSTISRCCATKLSGRVCNGATWAK